MKLAPMLFLLSITVLGRPTAIHAQNPASETRRPEVLRPLHHDVSLPLRDLNYFGRARTRSEFEPKRTDAIGHTNPKGSDALANQSFTTTAASVSAGNNFDGVAVDPNRRVAPPDTVGAVGATQYVQWVNLRFAVFDKVTGAMAAGFPKQGNAIWAGFADTACANNNDGDPIVQYDKAANRWVLTQFSVSTTPYRQCVAVSTTSDATGSYARYSYAYGSGFNDYPKVGVWPDGYYITYNMFASGVMFSGAQVCAFDRTAMLAGAPATQQCVQLSGSFGSLLPSDLDGSTPPPAGTPNLLLNLGTNALRLWKFHVDWANPANSTLTGPTSIAVAAFSRACGGGTCIPQPGTTNQLDSLADRLMYRLAYRNFGDHESLVVNHSVASNSVSGLRWYELRNSAGSNMANGTPVVYQQGTFQPDSNWRWMGSAAMDKVGNLAIGYSLASSTITPAIRFAYREPGDALGSLGNESFIFNGGGSQTSTLHRWGDYSTISVDPVDDCTLWYTTEYIPANGSFNWNTRIANFKFSTCGAGTNAPPTSSFSFNCTGLNCTFTDGSSDSDGTIASWNWNFGDSSTSTVQNPSHTFAAGGTYSVSLQVTDNGGANSTSTQNVTVSAGNTPPTSAFTVSCTNLNCTFTDASSDSDGTIASWNWSFGDSTGSVLQNPTHSYSAGGTYLVTLTVTDNGGASNSSSQNVTVTPASGFSLSALGYKVKGLQKADLTWSGAPAGSIDIFRNGSKLTTVSGGTTFTDNINSRGSGTYIYQVCQAGTSNCSNTATVVF